MTIKFMKEDEISEIKNYTQNKREVQNVRDTKYLLDDDKLSARALGAETGGVV